jgi:Ethanolamine ammonia lyase large subunit (EutB)
LVGRCHAERCARGTVADNVMYFETGQGSALSANAHHNVDQQTCEARATRGGAHLRSAADQHAGADFRLAGNAGLLPEFASRLIA